MGSEIVAIKGYIFKAYKSEDEFYQFVDCDNEPELDEYLKKTVKTTDNKAALKIMIEQAIADYKLKK